MAVMVMDGKEKRRMTSGLIQGTAGLRFSDGEVGPAEGGNG